MKLIRRENDQRYVHSEVIQLLDLLKMWGSLGKKLLDEKVSESNLEEWLKFVVNKKEIICCILDRGHC